MDDTKTPKLNTPNWRTLKPGLAAVFKLTSRIDIAERGMDQIALSGVMNELYGERLSVHAVELLEIKLI